MQRLVFGSSPSVHCLRLSVRWRTERRQQTQNSGGSSRATLALSLKVATQRAHGGVAQGNLENPEHREKGVARSVPQLMHGH